MGIATGVISFIYYCVIAFVSVLMIWNLIRTKSWEKETLYIVVLLPFLLRLFLLK